MKKTIGGFLAILTLLSCTPKTPSPQATINEPSKSNEEHVEVLYLHTRKRCATCKAIEEATKEVINSDFAQQVKDGKVVFQIIDLNTSAGDKIADKYKVVGTSLLVNSCFKDKIVKNNLTSFAFSKALNSKTVFMDSLKIKINELLAE